MFVNDDLEVLDDEECMRLLGSTTLGRVGVTVGALPAIFVVNYVLLDGSIVFRTGEGTKLRAALRNAVVAFEADLTDPIQHQGWSVQVVGVAETFTPEDPGFAGPTPWAPGEREHFVRVRPQFVSGRRIPRHFPSDIAV